MATFEVDVWAPPGKLGLVFQQSASGAHAIPSLRDGSPLVGRVLPGDTIARVRGEESQVDTARLSHGEMSALLQCLAALLNGAAA